MRTHPEIVYVKATEISKLDTPLRLKVPRWFLDGSNKPKDNGKRRVKKSRFGTPK